MFGIAQTPKPKGEHPGSGHSFLEPDEFLRAFTTGAKNEGFRLLFRKGLKAMPGGESRKVARSKAVWAYRRAR